MWVSPDGQMGNSESRPSQRSARDASLRRNCPDQQKAVQRTAAWLNPALEWPGRSPPCRWRTAAPGFGLCSDGGVHSHLSHLAGLLAWAAGRASQDGLPSRQINRGPDTPPQSAIPFIARSRKRSRRLVSVASATLCAATGHWIAITAGTDRKGLSVAQPKRPIAAIWVKASQSNRPMPAVSMTNSLSGAFQQ